MQWVRSNGLQYLRFANLAKVPGISHGIFLRSRWNHGREPVPFNAGLGCGTPDHDVWRNRQHIVSLMGNGAIGIFARQVHGRKVAVWNGQGAGWPQNTDEVVRLEGDALVTSTASAVLFIMVADCQPVILVDPVHKAVANIHSGWRGSIQNIIGETIASMTHTFGSKPDQLICGVGPSLGPCCAEFVNYRNEIPQTFWRYRLAQDHFDFWRISRDQLVGAGVPSANIEISGVCTKCNPHLFYSYRKERRTGRFAAVVGIHSR